MILVARVCWGDKRAYLKNDLLLYYLHRAYLKPLKTEQVLRLAGMRASRGTRAKQVVAGRPLLVQRRLPLFLSMVLGFGLFSVWSLHGRI